MDCEKCPSDFEAVAEGVEVGDHINFYDSTSSDNRKHKRVVKGFARCGCPTVRYQGYDDFAVLWDEIAEVVKKVVH